MITTTCIQNHILRLQYLHARLGGIYVADLKVGGCHSKCYSNALIVASKYISMLYCYRVFPVAPTMVLAVEENSISNLSEALVEIEALPIPYLVERYDGILYVYSYNPAAQPNVVLALFDPIDIEVGVVYSDITSDPCDLITAWNCLNPSELCNIIQHGYSLLNVAAPDYGSILPENLDTHFLNL